MSRERTRCQSSYLDKSLCEFLARPFRLTNVPSIFIGMIKALFYIYTITLWIHYLIHDSVLYEETGAHGPF